MPPSHQEHIFRLVQKVSGERKEGKYKIIYNMLKRCLTFSDALAPSAALALRSVGALLLVLAIPCVIWIGIHVEEER